MPAKRGPKPEQLSQESAVDGQVLTAGPVFPSYEDPTGGGGGGGTAGSSGVVRQEVLAGETITTDQAISTQLMNTPISVESVTLFLNGVLQTQDSDYMVSSTDDRTLIWLAGTGTAVTTSSIDLWVVVYESES